MPQLLGGDPKLRDAKFLLFNEHRFVKDFDSAMSPYFKWGSGFLVAQTFQEIRKLFGEEDCQEDFFSWWDILCNTWIRSEFRLLWVFPDEEDCNC